MLATLLQNITQHYFPVSLLDTFCALFLYSSTKEYKSLLYLCWALILDSNDVSYTGAFIIFLELWYCKLSCL